MRKTLFRSASVRPKNMCVIVELIFCVNLNLRDEDELQA